MCPHHDDDFTPKLFYGTTILLNLSDFMLLLALLHYYQSYKTKMSNLAAISKSKLARSITASKLARIVIHAPRTTKTK